MMPNSGPNIYDTQYTSVPYQIGGEEQVFDGSYKKILPDTPLVASVLIYFCGLPIIQLGP